MTETEWPWVRHSQPETRRNDALREVRRAEEALRLAIRAFEDAEDLTGRNMVVGLRNGLTDLRIDLGDLDIDDT